MTEYKEIWDSFDKHKDILKAQYESQNWNRNSGLEPKSIRRQCIKIDIDGEKKPLMTVKSELLEFVLKNAQIEINPNEFFADRINHDNIMSELIWNRRSKKQDEAYAELDITARQLVASGDLCVTMDYGHLAPDWSFVVGHGIPGILERIRKNCLKMSEKSEFFDSCERAYNAIAAFMLRLAEEARTYNTPKTDFVADNLEFLAGNPPETLAQAMQLTFIIYTVQTQIDVAIIRSLGGIDRMYGRFYESDLKSGRFSEEQLRELTRDFLYKIYAMKTAANLPFYICSETNTPAADAYTLVLLEEYRQLDILDPKIHVMYHEKISQQAVRLILEMIREGKSSFVFINTQTARAALESIGIEPCDTRNIIPYACYETSAEGKEVPCTCAARLNLSKVLELTLFNGTDPINGYECGKKTGERFCSFDKFYAALKTQLKYVIDTEINILNAFEKKYPQLYPLPVYSSTLEECMQCGIDAFSGGAKYNNTSIVAAGLATLVDSVIALKKAVFEEKNVDYDEFIKILKSDWKLNPDLHHRCLEKYPKYGNNNLEADQIAIDICNFTADNINGRKNGRGGVYRCGMFSIDWRFGMGKNSGATPDGRMSGTPVSKNFLPTSGQDKNGITAEMISALKIDAKKVPDGCVLDLILHCSSVCGEDGLNAMNALIKTYMNNDGFAIQFNVFNPETLRCAQREPEKYKNLQVRLCGWNVYFVNLSREEQDEFIHQAIVSK